MPSDDLTGTQSALILRERALLTIFCQFRSPSVLRRGRHSSWGRCQIMVRGGFHGEICTASSTRARYAIGGLLPSIPQDAVKMATGRDASIRWARALPAKPPK